MLGSKNRDRIEIWQSKIHIVERILCQLEQYHNLTIEDYNSPDIVNLDICIFNPFMQCKVGLIGPH